ncbi:MAG: carboxypeptidase regulatory-like domain-containing protein, partial [Planctomycetes bacterium]|nr:carboxypeptidase regulatory-like domain-containing protein [Planctomycetota bacterium]
SVSRRDRDDGKFTLANLPGGKYTVEAWHEHFKATRRLEIQLRERESITGLEFEFFEH